MSAKSLVFLFSFLCTSFVAFAQHKVVLKLDDIGVKNGVCVAKPVMDYLLQKNIKASYGVIANRLDGTALSTLGKYIEAKNTKGENIVEIWHHGYDHTNNNTAANLHEFKGTSYGFQKTHFNKADSLVKERLGIQMHSFGSPFNAVDSITLKVIAENPNYKSLMFFWGSLGKEPQLTRLNNRVDLENGVGNPDYDYFVKDLAKHADYKKSFIVLQGHPNQWNEAKIEQFKKVIDYLIKQRFEFVLPIDLIQN